jgi:hypothetical protein
VAACLLLDEDAAQAGDFVRLQSDIDAGRTAGLAEQVEALGAAIATSRPSVALLEAREETAPLAAAWAALYQVETDALTAIRAALEAGDAKALAAASKALDGAEEARTAVADAQTALVIAYPEATCQVQSQ